MPDDRTRLVILGAGFAAFSAVGAVSNTFGVPGAAEHALFLKELEDARAVRQRVPACLEKDRLETSMPWTTARHCRGKTCPPPRRGP